MSNPNPYAARLAAAARRKPGDLDEVRARTWGALLQSYTDIGVSDPEQRRKALLAYAQLAGVYVRLLEVGEHEARLTKLETLIAQQLPAKPRGQKGKLHVV